MNRKELKSMAKEQIKGKIWNLLAVTLVISVIIIAASFVLSLIPAVGSLLASLFVAPAFVLSIYKIYLSVVNEDKKPAIADAFSGFDDFWSACKTQILTNVLVSLWSLLLFVPGIIKSFAYSQAFYILAENKGMSAREAITRSKVMMDGHKMDYFVLSLSFIGWALLGSITFGIAYIWIVPYMQATYANFYNSIKPAADAAAEAVEAPAAEVEA